MKRVVVVGSFVMDLVVWASRRPVKGESILGDDFAMFPGGKGANQAVAAARLGADVAMIGRLGEDAFGDMFLQVLSEEGINSEYVMRDSREGTGVGTPVIDSDGDNSIIMIPRANKRLSVEDINNASRVLEQCDVLLVQLEVPVEASMRAAEIAHKAHAKVILDPAPAMSIPEEFFPLIDIIMPNEVEFQMLTGTPADTLESVKKGSRVLMDKGIEAVIVTVGPRGAFVVGEGYAKQVPAWPVDKVWDTTGAGDAFAGAFAVAQAGGLGISDSVNLAVRAGAYSVTKAGAIPSMPSLSDLGISDSI
jgi:ribokinase